jgi:hypothetical protein
MSRKKRKSNTRPYREEEFVPRDPSDVAKEIVRLEKLVESRGSIVTDPTARPLKKRKSRASVYLAKVIADAEKKQRESDIKREYRNLLALEAFQEKNAASIERRKTEGKWVPSYDKEPVVLHAVDGKRATEFYNRMRKI